MRVPHLLLQQAEAGLTPPGRHHRLCLHPHPQTSPTQSDVALKSHQYIAGFQIPVDDPLVVQEVEGFQHLAANHLNLGLGEASVQLWKQRELLSVQQVLAAGTECQAHTRDKKYKSHKHN